MRASVAPKAPRKEAHKRLVTQKSLGWRGAESAAPLLRIQGGLNVDGLENGDFHFVVALYLKF